jgi:hypothetical protein
MPGVISGGKISRDENLGLGSGIDSPHGRADCVAVRRAFLPSVFGEVYALLFNQKSLCSGLIRASTCLL